MVIPRPRLTEHTRLVRVDAEEGHHAPKHPLRIGEGVVMPTDEEPLRRHVRPPGVDRAEVVVALGDRGRGEKSR